MRSISCGVSVGKVCSYLAKEARPRGLVTLPTSVMPCPPASVRRFVACRHLGRLCRQRKVRSSLVAPARLRLAPLEVFAQRKFQPVAAGTASPEAAAATLSSSSCIADLSCCRPHWPRNMAFRPHAMQSLRIALGWDTLGTRRGHMTARTPWRPRTRDFGPFSSASPGSRVLAPRGALWQEPAARCRLCGRFCICQGMLP